MSMSSTELKEAFTRDGYIVVPHLFSQDEVQALKLEIRRVLDEVRQEAEQAGKDAQNLFSNGVYVGLAARSSLFRQALRDERLLDVLEALLGPNIEFLSDKAVFKDAEKDFASPWHQDWSYWQGSHKISAWVALDDATPQNGCLKVVPGSHRTTVLHNGDASDNLGFVHRLRSDAVDERSEVTAPLEAGGALFFHDLTLHASHPNTSHQDRWVWIPTYRDAQAEDPFYPWAVAAAVVHGTGRS
jgi:phytanoyl-CoA hydroxylase